MINQNKLTNSNITNNIKHYSNKTTKTLQNSESSIKSCRKNRKTNNFLQQKTNFQNNSKILKDQTID